MASYLVTGASRGIGLELTKQLLELPVSQVGKVFAVTRSDSSAPLRDLVEKSPDRAVHITASVDDTESVQRAARDVKAKLGTQGLDVLVNNAGQQAFAPGGTKTAPPEQLAHLFDVNVIGPHRMIAAFLPLLETGNQKKVINVYVLVRVWEQHQGQARLILATVPRRWEQFHGPSNISVRPLRPTRYPRPHCTC